MSGILHGCLSDVAREMEKGVFDFTDNGRCIQCGSCCSDLLPMTEKEIKVIKEYVRKNDIKESMHMCLLAEPHFDLTCPFLDTSKDKEKCKIYEVRPRVCRDFICCPSKRKNMNEKFVSQCVLVDVRSTFFNEE